MKGKIIVLLFVFVWGLGACSNEEQIGPSDQNGEDITISASLSAEVLSADAVQTKAGSLITDQEKVFQNTLVMIFGKNNSGKLGGCLGWATGEGNTPMPVKTKTGSVRLVAIANAEATLVASLKDAYDKKTLTYDLLDGKVTSQALGNPENLIKVGEKDLTLTHADDNKPLTIELVHLPARVEVKIVVTDKSGANWEFVASEYSVDKIRSASDLILTAGGVPPRVSNNQTATATLSNQPATGGILFYTYEKETQSEPLTVKISGALKNIDEGTSVNKTYMLPINPRFDGGNSKTNGIAHGYAYLVTGKIDATVPGMTIDIKVVPMQKLPVNVDYGQGETWK